MPGNQQAQLSDYLALERTSLAWIRTGLALMGFGFVVARFGLFLQQIEFLQHTASDASPGLGLWFGTALIAVGVLVNLYSGWHHLALVKRLERGEIDKAHAGSQIVIVAGLLVAVGTAMAIYLILVRHPGT
jgi:putative membrane protein